MECVAKGGKFVLYNAETNRLMDDVRFSFERGTAIYMRRMPAPRQQ